MDNKKYGRTGKNKIRTLRIITYVVSVFFVATGMLLVVFGSMMMKTMGILFVIMGVFTFLEGKKDLAVLDECMRENINDAKGH